MMAKRCQTTQRVLIRSKSHIAKPGQAQRWERAAPTGRKMIAQGNALGSSAENKSGIVRAKQMGAPPAQIQNQNRNCAALSGLGNLWGDANPGRRCAFPWAIICRPFRAAVVRRSCFFVMSSSKKQDGIPRAGPLRLRTQNSIWKSSG
jgi:hypothetical protein